MRIYHNIAALNTYRQLDTVSQSANKNMERLSSGLRINRAADDAAGLAISEKMRAQIRGLNQASRNAQDGISLLQTAEGALNETHSALQRMRELATQAANGTTSDDDRQQIQNEINALISQVDQIGTDTQFNGKRLLDGSLSKTSRFAMYANGGTSAGVSDVTVSNDAEVGAHTITISNAGAASTDLASIISTGTFYSAAATAATGTTKLTALTDVGGISLGIQVGDEITISAVVGGEVKSAVFTVEEDSDLDDLNASIKTALNASAIEVEDAATTYAWGTDVGATGTNTAVGQIVITGQTGTGNAITSFSITAKSSTGIERTSFNTVGETFNEIQIAADAGDKLMRIADPSGDNSYISVHSNDTFTKGNLTVSFGSTIANNGTATVTVGSIDKSIAMQIGANENQDVKVAISGMTAEDLGLTQNGVNISVLTTSSASSAITTIDDAISKVIQQRSTLGAMQNRLEYTINNLNSTSENMTTAESRIRDVDYALAA